jgi:hypothetical protein
MVSGMLVVAVATPVSGQWVVYDAATTARNSVTAAVKEFLFETERQQHTKIREMARRLSALTSLRKYAMEEVPRWRTHGSPDFRFATGYLDALIFGDAAGAEYLAVAHALQQSDRIDRLPPLARRSVLSRLATVNGADAAAIAATHASGQLRLLGRRGELQAIDALERDVIDPSSIQSTTAVLDKISGAALIGARQRQARIQLLVGMVEQLLVDSKRARDTDTAALAMQMVTWRDGRAASEAFVAGSGDALRTWRQP